MKLYHGSNLKIDKIDFSKCRPYKDFGQGFYCTEIKEQAELMAKRVSRIYGGSPVVTRTFTKGLIDVNTLVKEMKYKRFSNQFSFHTEKALKFLEIIEGE